MKKGCPKTSWACKSFWWTLKFPPKQFPKQTTAGSCRAVEKEMGCSFFLTVMAHHTVVSFIQHFLSSSQNIPRI
jgi:hypothetical protein